MMRRCSILLSGLGLLAVGCAHPHDAEIVATVERPKTIAAIDTIDTARLQGAENATQEAATRQLAELIAAHMATVGMVRALDAGHVEVELPAPGWILRARLVPKPELFCMLTLEPLYTQPKEQLVQAAPWSVQDALFRVHGGVILLRPPKERAMTEAQFARLRHEATAAAQANRDALLTPVEFKRTPRPIVDDPDQPYYTPTTDANSGEEASPRR